MELQEQSGEGHYLRGIQLIDHDERVEMSEKTKHMSGWFNKLIKTPFGEFTFSLSAHSQDLLSRDDFGDGPIGDIVSFAIDNRGDIFEDTLINLTNKGYASSTFEFSQYKLSKRVSRVNLWLEGLPVRLFDAGFFDRESGESMRGIDLTNWKTEEGVDLGNFYLPLNDSFLRRLRINFESVGGGDVN